MEKKRITSAKTKVAPIVEGRFFKAEGFTPSYVLTKSGQRLSRVRILATVVDKHVSESGRFASLTLDDGSATVRAKAFGGPRFEGVEKGDIVDAIGRVREYGGEIYVMPEVLCRIGDANFELLRELEIRHAELRTERKKALVREHAKQTADMGELSRLMEEQFNISAEETEAFLAAEEKDEVAENRKDEVLSLIEKLDAGEGCDYAELLEASGLSEEAIDSAINELLGEGVCFEPRPGKIKKL